MKKADQQKIINQNFVKISRTEGLKSIHHVYFFLIFHEKVLFLVICHFPEYKEIFFFKSEKKKKFNKIKKSYPKKWNYIP